jgi:hypothetical protein
MLPRPLHRWKSFWLGLLVLVFLGCGWVRSMGFRDDVGWESTRGEVIGAAQAGGTVRMFLFAGFPMNRGFYHETGVASFPTWFPRGTWRLFESSGRSAEIGIAHWFLILLFLVPWSGFLVWRVRRMERLKSPGPKSIPS